MKCLACGKEYDSENMSKCPACGFMGAKIIGEISESDRIQFETAAKNFRDKKLGDAKVSIVVYEWKANSEEIMVLDKKEYVELAVLTNIKPSEIKWFDEQFARVDGDSVDLLIAIEKDGSKKEINVNMPVPKEAEFWKVGVSLEDGFTIMLHIKTKNEETVSKAIEIF